MVVLVAVAVIAADVLCLVLVWVRRMSALLALGVLALAHLAAMVVSACADDHVVAGVHAATTALDAWLWWRGGGGDGTRWLRALRRPFAGVRRTAAAASEGV